MILCVHFSFLYLKLKSYAQRFYLIHSIYSITYFILYFWKKLYNICMYIYINKSCIFIQFWNCILTPTLKNYIVARIRFKKKSQTNMREDLWCFKSTIYYNFEHWRKLKFILCIYACIQFHKTRIYFSSFQKIK